MLQKRSWQLSFEDATTLGRRDLSQQSRNKIFNLPNPVPERVLLEELFGEVLEITFRRCRMSAEGHPYAQQDIHAYDQTTGHARSPVFKLAFEVQGSFPFLFFSLLLSRGFLSMLVLLFVCHRPLILFLPLEILCQVHVIISQDSTTSLWLSRVRVHAVILYISRPQSPFPALQSLGNHT